VTSEAGSTTGARFDAFAFYDLRDAVPALAAFVVLPVAEATVDDVAVLALILLGTIVGLFAVLAYREAGDRGDRRRRPRQRFIDALDATERKARRAAVRLPLVAGVVVALIPGVGLPDVKIPVATVVAGFLVAQVVFALWLNARHSARDVRG
jgi:hypothetical protein